MNIRATFLGICLYAAIPAYFLLSKLDTGPSTAYLRDNGEMPLVRINTIEQRSRLLEQETAKMLGSAPASFVSADEASEMRNIYSNALLALRSRGKLSTHESDEVKKARAWILSSEQNLASRADTLSNAVKVAVQSNALK